MCGGSSSKIVWTDIVFSKIMLAEWKLSNWKIEEQFCRAFSNCSRNFLTRHALEDYVGVFRWTTSATEQALIKISTAWICFSVTEKRSGHQSSPSSRVAGAAAPMLRLLLLAEVWGHGLLRQPLPSAGKLPFRAQTDVTAASAPPTQGSNCSGGDGPVRLRRWPCICSGSKAWL